MQEVSDELAPIHVFYVFQLRLKILKKMDTRTQLKKLQRGKTCYFMTTKEKVAKKEKNEEHSPG